jgi:hypothetical protein
MMQVIFTPVFNAQILKNRNKRMGEYFATVGYAFLLYFLFDFVIFRDAAAVTNNLNLQAPMLDLYYFQILLPRCYCWFSADTLK